MLDLHDREWKEFYLRDIFPDIQRGKRLKTADHIQGSIPYVSSSAINNGVDAFIGNGGKVRKFEECLTLANSGSVGKTFYHSYEFIASDHVTSLKSDKLNKYSYLFIATIVQRLEEKYSFNREINDVRINKEKIVLPVDESGNPDYAFMEQYIKEREKQIVQNYIDYIGNNIQIGGGITPLNQKDWKEFFVEDVVTILPGRDIYDAERIPGKTPYVSSSSVNNGICHFVNNANDTLEANCISVNRNGSVGFAFYHPYEALFSNDCRKLRPKYESNYISLFIATQITAQRNKYSYGYKMGTARLKRQKIMLPTTDNGTPDYDYMEQYVRQQIATLKLQYLQEKMTVAI